MITFDALLTECSKMKIDDLDIFIDILKNRAREKRREQIHRAALKGRADRKAGKKFMTLADLAEL